MILTPRLIVSSGIPAAGKSTTCRELARRIDNAVYLDRDDALNALMHVFIGENLPSLPPFPNYVINDRVFHENTKLVHTPFGEMISILPKNDFYRRHGRHQSHMVIGKLAATSLKLGKVAILDCFLPRQISDGTLGRFFEQEDFRGIEKYLLYFVCTPETCMSRAQQRAQEDPQAAVQVQKAGAQELIHDAASRNPPGLSKLRHLYLDTTELSVEKAIDECLEYIQPEMKFD